MALRRKPRSRLDRPHGPSRTSGLSGPPGLLGSSNDGGGKSDRATIIGQKPKKQRKRCTSSGKAKAKNGKRGAKSKKGGNGAKSEEDSKDSKDNKGSKGSKDSKKRTKTTKTRRRGSSSKTKAKNSGKKRKGPGSGSNGANEGKEEETQKKNDTKDDDTNGAKKSDAEDETKDIAEDEDEDTDTKRKEKEHADRRRALLAIQERELERAFQPNRRVLVNRPQATFLSDDNVRVRESTRGTFMSMDGSGLRAKIRELRAQVATGSLGLATSATATPEQNRRQLSALVSGRQGRQGQQRGHSQYRDDVIGFVEHVWAPRLDAALSVLVDDLVLHAFASNEEKWARCDVLDCVRWTPLTEDQRQRFLALAQSKAAATKAGHQTAEVAALDRHESAYWRAWLADFGQAFPNEDAVEALTAACPVFGPTVEALVNECAEVGAAMEDLARNHEAQVSAWESAVRSTVSVYVWSRVTLAWIMRQKIHEAVEAYCATVGEAEDERSACESRLKDQGATFRRAFQDLYAGLDGLPPVDALLSVQGATPGRAQARVVGAILEKLGNEDRQAAPEREAEAEAATALSPEDLEVELGELEAIAAEVRDRVTDLATVTGASQEEARSAAGARAASQDAFLDALRNISRECGAALDDQRTALRVADDQVSSTAFRLDRAVQGAMATHAECEDRLRASFNVRLEEARAALEQLEARGAAAVKNRIQARISNVRSQVQTYVGVVLRAAQGGVEQSVSSGPSIVPNAPRALSSPSVTNVANVANQGQQRQQQHQEAIGVARARQTQVAQACSTVLGWAQLLCDDHLWARGFPLFQRRYGQRRRQLEHNLRTCFLPQLRSFPYLWGVWNQWFQPAFGPGTLPSTFFASTK